MSFPAVPLAQSRPIDDRTLAHLRRIGHDAPQSNASEAESEWLLSVVGPLLDELAARRAVMAASDIDLSAIDLTNVRILAAVR